MICSMPEISKMIQNHDNAILITIWVCIYCRLLKFGNQQEWNFSGTTLGTNNPATTRKYIRRSKIQPKSNEKGTNLRKKISENLHSYFFGMNIEQFHNTFDKHPSIYTNASQCQFQCVGYAEWMVLFFVTEIEKSTHLEWANSNRR